MANIMPVKHQSDCYRMLGGKKYTNYCDILELSHWAIVASAKAAKIRHRVFKHPDGYSQFFVHPDDKTAVDLLNNLEYMQ